MILPIGDTPNPRGFVPWVNWALIAANVAVFVFVTLPLEARPPDPDHPDLLLLLQQMAPPGVSPAVLLQHVSAYDLFVFEHGYRPGHPEISDLFTAMFLHGGFAHLAGNMLFLWIYGDNVEHRLGRLGYLLLWLGTGVAATLSWAFLAADPEVPLVGASGAISGVLGVYFLHFPYNRIKLLVAFFPWIMRVLLVPARLVLGAYVLLDNLLPLVAGASSNVAYGAHLGGFFAGLLLAWVLDRRDTAGGGPDPLEPALGGEAAPAPLRAPAPLPPHREIRALSRAIDRGDRAAALGILRRVPADLLADLDPAQVPVLARWLEEAGEARAAATLRSLGGMDRSRKAARALEHVHRAEQLIARGQETAAYRHLVVATRLDPDGPAARRARELLARYG